MENTEINMRKSSNSNAGMNRRSKQNTKMTNARKDGAYRLKICQVKSITDLLSASSPRTRFSPAY